MSSGRRAVAIELSHLSICSFNVATINGALRGPMPVIWASEINYIDSAFHQTRPAHERVRAKFPGLIVKTDQQGRT